MCFRLNFFWGFWEFCFGFFWGLREFFWGICMVGLNFLNFGLEKAPSLAEGVGGGYLDFWGFGLNFFGLC